MLFNEISTKTGVQSLSLSFVIDQDTKEKTGWLRHWDNDNRVAVSLHEDTAKVLSNANKRKSANFGVQTEERQSQSGKSYTSHRIVMYKDEPDMVINL